MSAFRFIYQIFKIYCILIVVSVDLLVLFIVFMFLFVTFHFLQLSNTHLHDQNGKLNLNNKIREGSL